MTFDPGDYRRGVAPDGRCSRLADELLSALDGSGNYRPGDRVIVMVTPAPPEDCGMGMRGYHHDADDPLDDARGDAEAVADMFFSLRAVLRARGKDLSFGTFEGLFGPTPN